jgi:hypothetical protein
MITKRQLVGAVAALVLSASMAGSAFGADIGGKWTSEFQGPDGNTRTHAIST